MDYEGLYRDIAARCRNGMTSADLMNLAKDDYPTDPESDLYVYLGDLLDEGEDIGSAVPRMRAFMANLVNAIGADGNGEIDEAELRQFTEIMKCSSVTSASDSNEDGYTDKDWEILRHIQSLARETLGTIEGGAALSEVLSRQKHPRTKFLRSDFHKAAVEGALSIRGAGECGLVAYINYAGGNTVRVEICLETWDKAGKASFYRELFGTDSLQLDVTPEVNRYGSYEYDLGIIDDKQVAEFVKDKFKVAINALENRDILA